MTDRPAPGYTPARGDPKFPDLTLHKLNHSQRYVAGDVHTNTIEGFWAHLKRAWYGQHHHYSKSYMPLYIAEACWKYNSPRSRGRF